MTQDKTSVPEVDQEELIRRAEEATQRLLAATAANAASVLELQTLQVENTFAGNAVAGQVDPVVESDKEYAARMMRGGQ